MTQDSSFREFPTYVQKSSPKVNPLVVFGSVVIIALLAGGGYYYFGVMKKESSKASPVPVTPKPTMPNEASLSGVLTPVASGTATPSTKAAKTTPAVAPTSAAKKELDRSKLRIAVLNGSGVPGAAKEISTDLTDAGYTIASVGNAEEYTYKDITVKITKSKSEYLSLLQKDIKKSMPDTVVTTKIDDKIETDAEVIVGK